MQLPAKAATESPISPKLETGDRIRLIEVRWLVAIFAVAAALRVIWVQRYPIAPESDYATFWTMAQLIADGEWRPRDYGWVYQGAGFPTMLAPLVWLGGGLDAARTLNIVAQLVMVGVVWFVARRVYGPLPALMAASLAAVLPGLWTYTTLVAAESVATALLMLVCAGFLTHRSPIWPVAAGMALGLLAFTRPAFLPFLAVGVVAIFLATPTNRFRRLTLFLGGFIIAAVPFAGLNLATDGPALPTGASGWQTWLVNNEHSTGAWIDAASRQDYPFAGLTDDAEIRAAQQELGLRFMAVNPVVTIEHFVQRLRANWQSDDMGMFWTVDRQTVAPWAAPPSTGLFHDTANYAYALILMLAAIAAVRNRTNPRQLLPLILPLAYGVALLSASEANGRYHAVFLPLLCAIAGGSVSQGSTSVLVSGRISYRRRAQRESVPILVLAGALIGGMILVRGDRWGIGQPESIGAWLVILTILTPLVGSTIAYFPRLWQGYTAHTWGRGWRRLATAWSLVLVVAIAVVGLTTTLDHYRQDVAAMSPDLWRAYDVVSGTEIIHPLTLVPSGTAPDLVEVSYPDAVELDFDQGVSPGAMTGIRRNVLDVVPGTSYIIYLQIYDPEMRGDPTEHVRVLLDGAVIWTSPPTQPGTGTWHYVTVPWTPGFTSGVLDVQRIAGGHYDPSWQATPLVRTFQLYSAAAED